MKKVYEFYVALFQQVRRINVAPWIEGNEVIANFTNAVIAVSLHQFLAINLVFNITRIILDFRDFESPWFDVCEFSILFVLNTYLFRNFYSRRDGRTAPTIHMNAISWFMAIAIPAASILFSAELGSGLID